MCRELVGARLSSLRTGLTGDHTFVRLLQHLRCWLSLKPRLGGSSDSQIELGWPSFHAAHNFASSKDTAVEAHALFQDRSKVPKGK